AAETEDAGADTTGTDAAETEDAGADAEEADDAGACSTGSKNTEAESETVLCVYGGGYGHGNGMSQCGAALMAARGASCEEILEYYFISE
ncbi:MAG: hypothetical protein LIP12_04115, partial [Clostridiales bacterium]|nr:hypothetical protein [Clostridiales bacterium]